MTQFVRDKADRYHLELPLSTPLWRYQDLTKLLWTLANSSLWFARADTLGDPYEGSTTKGHRTFFAEALGTASNADDMLAQLTRLNRSFVRNTAVNCWHASEHESAAMWNLHVGSGQGIAIQSTIERLVNAFAEGDSTGSGRTPSGEANVLRVDFGAVRYIDHLTTNMAPVVHNARDAFFWKRKSFEHEREFRALVLDVPIRDNNLDFDHSVFSQGGVAIPVDVGTLIEAIYVPPGAPAWFMQVVEVAVQRFGCDFPVFQSRLDMDPIF